MIVTAKRKDSPIFLKMELSTAEAMILRTILRNVGGAPHGPREVADKINSVLQEEVGFYDVGSGQFNLPSTWYSMRGSEIGTCP